MTTFFRNITLFRFSAELRESLETLSDRLAGHVLKPLGPLELATTGFISPFGRDHEHLSHRVGHRLLIALGGEKKILPAGAVNEAVAKKLIELKEREGRAPGGKERKRIKDEVLLDMIPRAFASPSRTAAYLDLDAGWLVVDTSSRKNSEAVVSAVREALGSFPAVPVQSEDSPRAILTGWLGSEELPEGLALADECELREPVDGGAIVKCRRQEMTTTEIRELLAAGKQCFQLGLVFKDRLSFVLGEDLVIRKLRFLEIDEEHGDLSSLEAVLDAQFALLSGEIGELLSMLEKTFHLARP